MVQNYSLVWADSNIDETDMDCRNTLTQLRGVVGRLTLYTQPDKCIQFLKRAGEEKVFVITSGSLGQHLVPAIHPLPNIDAIYIFCGNKSIHEQWAQTWVKIKGVHTDIKDICEILKAALKQCDQESIAINFVLKVEGTSGAHLNQLEPTFMYTQIFKEILVEMQHEKQAIKDLAIYCRQHYHKNKNELKIINEFDRDYRPESAIWWYTRQCFTHQMLNRALRTLDGNIIINMGFFIHDLHLQVQALHKQQIDSYHAEPFIVYRGQGLSKSDFGKLSKTRGGLISFNTFLSTSTDKDVSLDFANRALRNANMVGILFKMYIDPGVSSAPFANIKEVSYFKTEEEILFSMLTVFRVGEIHQMDNNGHLHEVNLRLTADDDEQLSVLTKLFAKEVSSDTGWRRLGTLLLKIGQLDKAEELYKTLLKQTSNESEKGYYYHHLGAVKNNQGDHQRAIDYYHKALEIFEKSLAPTHPALATSYNNIGLVYDHMGKYSKALAFYNKALEIDQETLAPTHPDLATSYNNIGLVYKNMGEYSKALSYYNKALEIEEKTLPPGHPYLALSYNNIAGAYCNMGEYLQALKFHDKALEIQEKTLPPTHPHLVTSYKNISNVYSIMGKDSKAQWYSQRARSIRRPALSAGHPHSKSVKEIY